MKPSFEDNWNRERKALYNFCFRLTGNREDAADITQMTAIKACQAYANYDPAHRFLNWICRIAQNTCRDMLRNRHRRVQTTSYDEPIMTDMGEMMGEFADENTGEAHVLAPMILADRMKTLKFLIGPEKAEILNLRYLQDYSYAEIAQIQRCPIGTVRSRINRACRVARHALAG